MPPALRHRPGTHWWPAPAPPASPASSPVSERGWQHQAGAAVAARISLDLLLSGSSVWLAWQSLDRCTAVARAPARLPAACLPACLAAAVVRPLSPPAHLPHAACLPCPADPPDTVKSRLQVQGASGAGMVYSSTLDAFAKIGAREVRAPGLRGGGLPACCRLLLLGEGECAAAAAAVESACQGCTASTSGSSRRCRCLPACSQPAFCVAFHPPACLPARRTAGPAGLLPRLWRHTAHSHPSQHVLLQVSAAGMHGRGSRGSRGSGHCSMCRQLAHRC
jgi:hypothetical protein